jgi:hypothetical protein
MKKRDFSEIYLCEVVGHQHLIKLYLIAPETPEKLGNMLHFVDVPATLANDSQR